MSNPLTELFQWAGANSQGNSISVKITITSNGPPPVAPNGPFTLATYAVGTLFYEPGGPGLGHLGHLWPPYFASRRGEELVECTTQYPSGPGPFGMNPFGESAAKYGVTIRRSSGIPNDEYTVIMRYSETDHEGDHVVGDEVQFQISYDPTADTGYGIANNAVYAVHLYLPKSTKV